MKKTNKSKFRGKAELPKFGQWTLCSEQLPKENDLVLVCAEGTMISDTKEVTLGSYTKGIWTNGLEQLQVIAWQPLPEPPYPESTKDK